MAIKAIIFDYFGVVSSDQYWQLVKRDKNVRSDFGDLADSVNTGEITWGQFVKTVSKKINKPESEIQQLYENERLDPRLIDYIASLRPKYKTALLTNAHHDFLDPLIKKAHLHEVFDEIIISSQTGFIKPEPGIYIHALQKLQILPQEAVFIDDIARNVDGASAVGLESILYTDFDDFKVKIQEIL